MVKLYTDTNMSMPVFVKRGKRAGPTLFISAAIHGDELNGTEIVNRLLAVGAMKRLHGTLIAIPVLNVYGLINRSRYLPGGVDLDRCFPGAKSGTLASRVAHIFTEEIFSKADVCINLKTGLINCSNLPQVCVNFDDEQGKTLAKAFNAIMSAPTLFNHSVYDRVVIWAVHIPWLNQLSCKKGQSRTPDRSSMRLNHF